MSQRLTDRSLFSGSLNVLDLVHIVDVSDHTQNPAGSSYKLRLLDLSTFINARANYQTILDGTDTQMTGRSQFAFNTLFTVTDDSGDNVTRIGLDTTALGHLYVPLAGTATSYPLTGVVEFKTGTTALWQDSATGSGYFVGFSDNKIMGSSTHGSFAKFEDGVLTLNAYNAGGSQGVVNLQPNAAELRANNTGLLTRFFVIGNQTYVESADSGFVGHNYEATTAGYVTTNQTQYTLLHRAAGDARWAQLSGCTFTGNVNGVTPTELGYLSGATSNIQTQINNINAGLSWKAGVRVATTANITLSGAQTIDGVSVVAGDRVLVKDQSTASQNGVYVCASGAWSRSTDCSTGGSSAGSTSILYATVVVSEGSTYADQIWTCSTDAPITIGATSLTFVKTSATTYTGSDGITLTGNNFTLNNGYFSGDATVAAGVITIGAGKVTNSMLAGSIDYSKLASMTSANLASIVSDETGSGSLVFNTSPTFTTKLTSPEVDISGTGGNGFINLVAQSSNAAAPSVTGLNLFSGSTGALAWARKNGTDTYVRAFASTLTADRTYTLQDASGTLAHTTDSRWTKVAQFSALAAPADSTNYLICDVPDLTAATTIRAMKFPKAGTLNEVSFTLNQATNGSNETVTIYLRNITTATDYTIGTFTSDFGLNTTTAFVFSGLSIAVNTTDQWVVKIATPAWGTNPTAWRGAFTLLIN